MATKGAREVNFKKGQHSALSILIGNILNLSVRKSVVSQLQKTNFKKGALKKSYLRSKNKKLKIKNYNLNVTKVLVSDFKNAFSGIFNFTVGILRYWS